MIDVRSTGTDVVDVWRCLEVAFAAGIGATEFSEGPAPASAAIIRRLFASCHAPAIATMIEEQRLSHLAAERRFTRVRAFISSVSGI